MNQLVLALAMFAAEPPAATPDVKAVAEKLDKVELALKSMTEQNTKLIQLLGESVQKDINDLAKRVDNLQRDVDGLKRQHSPYTAAKPVETTTASVMLVNSRFDVPFEAVVNGITYWVEPGQNRTISVPAGSVGLQLITTNEAPKTRSLAAGATHVVTLR